jgi:4-hydroxy-3-methylbut-2-en-1-yl diphosphate reductase
VKIQIEKALEIGFCFGVRRAIDILEKNVEEYGKLDTLGAVVHNEQVMQRLSKLGINVVHNINDIGSNIVAISSHGVSPETLTKLKAKNLQVLDTTCPFVRRAQLSAKRLNGAGFFVVIYGDSEHSEVKGILGWAGGYGIATTNAQDVNSVERMPRRIGILSQTTQIPEKFTEFSKNILDLVFNKDVEIRILDTVCHDIRTRQKISFELAKRVDLMLVIGGQSSANTKRLLELCSSITESHLIDTIEAIDVSWLKDKHVVGVTSGTSTSIQTIDEVIRQLKISSLS